MTRSGSSGAPGWRSWSTISSTIRWATRIAVFLGLFEAVRRRECPFSEVEAGCAAGGVFSTAGAGFRAAALPTAGFFAAAFFAAGFLPVELLVAAAFFPAAFFPAAGFLTVVAFFACFVAIPPSPLLPDFRLWVYWQPTEWSERIAYIYLL